MKYALEHHCRAFHGLQKSPAQPHNATAARGSRPQIAVSEAENARTLERKRVKRKPLRVARKMARAIPHEASGAPGPGDSLCSLALAGIAVSDVC